MLDLCLMKILEVDLLALPSSPFFLLSFSFLLAYLLLFFLFGHDLRFLGVHGSVGRELMGGKGEKMTLSCVCTKMFLSLFLALLLAEHMLGGKVLFSFLLFFLLSCFKIQNCIKWPFTSCLVVFAKPCTIQVVLCTFVC